MRHLALAVLALLLPSAPAGGQPTPEELLGGLELRMGAMPDPQDPLPVGAKVPFTLPFTLACTGSGGSAGMTESHVRVRFTVEVDSPIAFEDDAGITVGAPAPVDVEVPDCVTESATAGEASFTLEATAAALGEKRTEVTVAADVPEGEAGGPLGNATAFHLQVAYVGKLAVAVPEPRIEVRRRQHAEFVLEVENLGNALTSTELKVASDLDVFAIPTLLQPPQERYGSPTGTLRVSPSAWDEADGEYPIRVVITPTSPVSGLEGEPVAVELLVVLEGGAKPGQVAPSALPPLVLALLGAALLRPRPRGGRRVEGEEAGSV